MMKKAILSVLLLSGLVGVLLLLEPHQETSPPLQSKTEGFVVDESPAFITSLEFSRPQGAMELSRGGEDNSTWRISSGYELDNNKVHVMVSKALRIPYQRILEVREDRWEDFGLDSENHRMVLTRADGEKIVLAVGNPVPSGTGYYTRREKEVFIIGRDEAEPFFWETGDFLPDYIPGINLSRLSRWEVKHQGNTTLKIEHSLHGYEVTEPIKNPRPLWDEKFLHQLQAILWPLEIESYIAQGELDNPEYQLIMTDREGRHQQLSFVQKEGRLLARVDQEDTVFTLKPDLSPLLEMEALDVVDRFLLLQDLEEVQEIIFTGKGNSQRIERTSEGWTLNGSPLEEALFMSLYKRVISLQFDGFLPEGITSPEWDLKIGVLTKDGDLREVAFAPWEAGFYWVKEGGLIPELVIHGYQIQPLIDFLESR